MLQWMGGSRRKVNASRKSMHNKQKHYFEQRKRQQQTTGLENHIDVSSKRVHYHEEPRSLDILSFQNLATLAQQGCSSHSFCFQPEILPPDKCSAVIAPENAPATQNLSSKVEGLKMSASSCEFSSNSNFKSEEKQDEIQDEVLVLNLLNNDNKEINCKGRAVPETHVAFSVEGLGKVGMETPVHSPRTQIRGFTSPPRATRRIQNSANFRSMSYDVGRELSAAMYDIDKLIDGDSAEVICKRKGTTYEKGNRKSMKFNDSYIYSDVLDDLSDCFGSGNENFQEIQNELWESSNGMLDDNFPGIREYDAVWENKSSYSESRASALSNEISGMYECGFDDFYLDRSRCGAKQQKKFSNSAKSDSLFSLAALEKGCNLVSPDKDRSIFDLSSWSFTQKEDLPDSVSSLSAESCSSTAVKEDKSYDSLSHSAKLKKSKKSHLDALDMSLMNLKESKKNHMNELDMSLGAGNYKCMPKQLNSRAQYCSKVSSEVQRVADPDCIFPLKEEFSSDFTQGRSKSNIPVDRESFYDFNFENNISRGLSGFAFQSQKPPTHIWMTEDCLPYSFSAGNNQNDTQMPDSVGQRNACKDKGELDSTIKLENKILSENSLYSLSDRENRKETPSEFLELNKRTQKSSSGPKANDPPEEAETPRKTDEVSGLQTDINDKVDQLDCSSPDLSEIRNKESVKEKLESEVTIFGSIAGKDFFKQRGAEATMKFNSFHIRLLHRQFVWELNN